MDNAKIQKMENLLDLNKIDFMEYTGLKRSAAYYQRRVHPEKYIAVLLGIRLQKSPLTIREILSILTPVEKIASKLRK